jgi:hypothetical protein
LGRRGVLTIILLLEIAWAVALISSKVTISSSTRKKNPVNLKGKKKRKKES